MATPEFPSSINVQQDYGYMHNAGAVHSFDGVGIDSARAYCMSSANINVTFVLSKEEDVAEFFDFYMNTTYQGTRKFKMNLNTTGEKLPHICLVVPGTLSVTGNNPYVISMTVEAESIPNPYYGMLFQYAQGGDDQTDLFNRLAIFANSDVL